MSIKDCIQTTCDTTEVNMDATETNLTDIRSNQETLIGYEDEAYLSSTVNIPNYQGYWLSGTTYSTGEIVAYSGILYIALRSTTADTPSTSTDDWVEFKTTIVPNKARGNIENTLLEMPLRTSLAMKSGTGSVTFERNSTATYKDKDGYIKYAEVDEPRFEEAGLLIEGYKTNWIGYSEDISQWDASECTIESDSILSPDGVSMADKLVCNSERDVFHYVEKAPEGTYPLYSTTRTFSGFFKYAGVRYVLLGITNEDNITFVVYFDLLEGKILTPNNQYVNYSIEEFVDGWYRCSVTKILDSGTGSMSGKVKVYASNIYNDSRPDENLLGAGFYMWGMQVETLDFASSYIPTLTGVTVARSAESCKVNAYGNHPNLHDGNELSMLCDVKLTYAGSTSNYRQIFGIGVSETGVNQYSMFRINWNTTNIRYYRDGTGILISASLPEEKFRIGVTVDEDTMTIGYMNGNVIDNRTQTLFSDDGVATNIHLGCKASSGSELYGHISNVKIYGMALSPYEMNLA